MPLCCPVEFEMVYELVFHDDGIASVLVPSENIINIIEPNDVMIDCRPAEQLVVECLENPIGMGRLSEELKGNEKVLILVDDYTRLTPTDVILPVMIKEIISTGVPLKNIELLIASGTHRAMNENEKIKKYGRWVMENVKVRDHLWYEKNQLTEIGRTDNGTDVVINSRLLEADFIIGIGHIVPHRVAGFSGGAKIVQPGVCGAVTTGQTHWLSAKDYVGRDIMGKIDNPVRDEINQVGIEAGLKFIFNTVQAGNGKVYACVCGEPVKAYRAGCRAAKDVYGCEIKELADIVISDAYPSNMNMWQSAKGVYSGDLALKDDGILILVSPCKEGIAVEHPEVGELGYSHPRKIAKMVESGEFNDLTVAAHILHVGRVITGKRKAIIVSDGINREDSERIGFIKADTVKEALDTAIKLKGSNASITIIKHGGEVMPVYRSK